MITLKGNIHNGSLIIPASKSQTIRAFLIATFAKGESKVINPLLSSDTEACIKACRALGAKITFSSDNSYALVDPSNVDVKGKSLVIDTMNSGTTTYLIYGLLATLGAKEITLTGDEQLNRRPILPLVNAYRELGVNASLEGETPPVTITGALIGGSCSIECRTSQYLSSLLLSLPLAKENSKVDCPLLYEKPYVEITLSWLNKQGIKYTISDDLQHVAVEGRQHYTGEEMMVTGDFSSAAFFFAAAAISGKSITVTGLDRNDPQGDKEFLPLLEKMGCTVSWDGYAVTVKGPKELKCASFDLNSMPDILPILSVVCLAAKGESKIYNVSQARIKETDRIRCMADNLSALGAEVSELEDGLVIKGSGSIIGGNAKGYGDHRIIMALAIASIIADEGITIDDERACSVTFPSFFTLFNSLKDNL